MCEKNISQKSVAFVFDSVDLHQTLTEYISYFDILTCQIWMQVMEGPLISLRFLGIFIHY